MKLHIRNISYKEEYYLSSHSSPFNSQLRNTVFGYLSILIRITYNNNLEVGTHVCAISSQHVLLSYFV